MLHFRSEDLSVLNGRDTCTIHVGPSIEYKVAKRIQDMQLIWNMLVLVV